MTDEEVPVDYDLTCWYLNARRGIELVGATNVAPQIAEIGSNCRH